MGESSHLLGNEIKSKMYPGQPRVSVEEEVVFHDNPPVVVHHGPHMVVHHSPYVRPVGFGRPRVSVEEEIIFHDNPAPVVHHQVGESRPAKCTAGTWIVVCLIVILLVAPLSYFAWSRRSSSGTMYTSSGYSGYTSPSRSTTTVSTSPSFFSPTGTKTNSVRTHSVTPTSMWNAPPPGHQVNTTQRTTKMVWDPNTRTNRLATVTRQERHHGLGTR